MNEKSPSITFQNRINNIKEGYEELGNLTIKLTGTVVRLLENYDETDFENIEECSTTIDIKTIDLERECIKFMATEQPLAKDLMFIESTLRVISHFKRISHLCLKIAKLIKNIQCADIPEKILKELECMGDYTLIILKKSFFVFSNQDLDKAKEYWQQKDLTNQDVKEILFEGQAEIVEILKEVIKQGKGIEINYSGLRQKIADTLPSYDIVKLYKSMGGINITVGSDAHRLYAIGDHTKEAMNILETVGFNYITLYENRIPRYLKI